MTKALNRRCFFLDAEKYAASLSAVLSIDLNDLKQWNDGHGHAKGDDAICTLVHCVQKVIPKACYLYRTGGDEFMILCFNKEKETVEQLLMDIRRELAPTPYSCAIGMAYRDRDQEFNQLCLQADSEMYEDKRKYHS